jgi:hypothetical protein
MSAGPPDGAVKGLPAEFRARMFPAGVSGNPGGMSADMAECRRLARAAAPAAMQKLIELVDHADARVALVAAEKVLDRALGKPKAIEETPDPASPHMEQLRAAAYTVVMQMLEERARAKSAAVDAEYVGMGGCADR